MKIEEVYKQKKRTLSFEIFPPKHEDALQNIDETLDILASLKPDFISITFGAGGSVNNNKTIYLAKKIKEKYGIEPLVHLTGLYYNKAEIDAFLAEMKKNGIENVLALRGDRREDVCAKEDFCFASDLMNHIQKSESDFCVAGACYPEVHPQSKNRVEDINALKHKTENGCAFLVSQLFFENDNFYDFCQFCKVAGVNVPISAGIMPVINKKQIEKMVSLCGAKLPPRFKRILETYGENKEALFDAGLSYAISQIIDLTANGVDGIHLYTMNNPQIAKRIVDGIKRII